MRAVWLTRKGGPGAFEVRETPDPQPAAGQVRIRVRAAGINFADVMASQGIYPGAPPTPCVLGYEAAGVVDALGAGVDPGFLGKRVLAMTNFGAQSEAICVDARAALAMPDAMSFEEGAALPLNYLTAYHMLFRVGGLRPGSSVLIHQAAGGVGIAALQLCRTVQEVTTYGTASSAKLETARANGCTHPIDYRACDYEAEVKRLWNGKRIDIALDALGGENWAKDYRLLAYDGRLICFGFAKLVSGGRGNLFNVLMQLRSVPKFNPMKLMNDNRSVAGVNLGRMWKAQDVLGAELREVLRLYEQGALKPHIEAVIPFADARSAFQRLQDGTTVGKIVLVP
jgi:synaptic vesicle membrane protein VAT-1